MIDELVIVHLPRDSQVKVPAALADLEWQTCLRRIVFLHRTELARLETSDLEIYRGREAYQFLLEVICGLHSPVLGETAVMGQFRKFRAGARFAFTPWGRFLRKLTTDLLVDARRHRAQHLQDLGSQSYGSLVRKHVKGISRVALVGTGSLAQEILPWLIGKTEIRLFYRSWLHAKRLRDKYPQVQLNQFKMADAGWVEEASALVVAVPLNSAEIKQWLALQSVRLSLILDLRGNAASDALQSSLPVIKLPELFASLHEERERLKHRVVAAREAIEWMTRQRTRQQECQAF